MTEKRIVKVKEKFERYVLEKDFFGDNVQEKYTIECEKIADDFAIEFAEWLDLDETQDLIYSLQIVGELPKLPKTKELLETFKKEKGW